MAFKDYKYGVLILIVVEDGLVLTLSSQMVMVWHSVLILIVVEDGLVQEWTDLQTDGEVS